LCKLQRSARLREAVQRRLCWRWSPQQIAADLKRCHPQEAAMQVSHESIYRSLFIQARGALKAELIAHLRRGGRYRRRQQAQLPQRHAAGPIPDAISIRERPAEAEDRAVPGHWEGDLIVGSHSSSIATLVERQSRYVLLLKIEDRRAATVAKALARTIRRLPMHLRRSLTWDRGSEMAGHVEFTLATDMAVYFCDPHSPWQRGSNENTNGLLRQYFPKGTELSGYTQRQLDTVAKELNQRPRKTLRWDTPAKALAKSLH
jgi:IS30 family transposase